jgi:hypothetical protein
MVGLIQVGDAPAALDPAEVEKLPTRPEDRLLDLIALAEDSKGEAAATQ